MNFFTKNRLLFWILMFLIVINITGLITFFVLYPRPVCNTDMPACDRSVTLMEQELGLTPEQSQNVAAIQQAYRDSAAPLADSIKQVRAELLTLLSEDQPDPASVDRLVAGLGRLQLDLQKASIRHYRALRAVCTPEQAQKLSNLFFELYGCPRKGQMMQHRYRHGMN